jgi:site-specific DNA-methyltransferase (adenine-specific)
MRAKIAAGEKMVRSKRDVWQMATADNKFEHFAMYPEHLVKPCIMAGTSAHGCCPKCKTPWIRQKKRPEKWRANCDCNEKAVQECLVLDPFNGSGTTGRVCMTHHRKYVGIDISSEYLNASRELLKSKDIFFTETDTLADVIE